MSDRAKPGDVTIRLTLPESVVVRLREHAVRHRRSVHDELVIALKVWLSSTEPGPETEPNANLTRLLTAVRSTREDGLSSRTWSRNVPAERRTA